MRPAQELIASIGDPVLRRRALHNLRIINVDFPWLWQVHREWDLTRANIVVRGPNHPSLKEYLQTAVDITRAMWLVVLFREECAVLAVLRVDPHSKEKIWLEAAQCALANHFFGFKVSIVNIVVAAIGKDRIPHQFTVYRSPKTPWISQMNQPLFGFDVSEVDCTRGSALDE